MADQIETFYRTAYTDNIRMQAMQMRSHLRESVDFEPSRGEFLMLDSYGEIDAGGAGADYLTAVTTRNADNVEVQVPRARRRIAPLFWELTEYFDPRDRPRLLRDIRPDSNYSRAVNGAFGRQMDFQITEAMDANAEDESGGAIAFDTTNSEIDDSVGANTGANVDKIIQSVMRMVQNKTQADVPWYCALHPIQIQQLFSFTNDDRLLSGDFNQMRPLQSGKIGSYMGVTFIPTLEIAEETIDTNPGRYMYFYSEDAMVFTMDGQVEVHFDIIPDKRHALQVAHYATFSSTRMHELKIIRAECATTAV